MSSNCGVIGRISGGLRSGSENHDSGPSTVGKDYGRTLVHTSALALSPPQAQIAHMPIISSSAQLMQYWS